MRTVENFRVGGERRVLWGQDREPRSKCNEWASRVPGWDESDPRRTRQCKGPGVRMSKEVVQLAQSEPDGAVGSEVRVMARGARSCQPSGPQEGFVSHRSV